MLFLFSGSNFNTMLTNKKSSRALRKTMLKRQPLLEQRCPSLVSAQTFLSAVPASYCFAPQALVSEQLGVRAANWKCIYTMSVPEGRDTKDKHSWRALRVGPRCARTLVRLRVGLESNLRPLKAFSGGLFFVFFVD